MSGHALLRETAKKNKKPRATFEILQASAGMINFKVRDSTFRKRLNKYGVFGGSSTVVQGWWFTLFFLLFEQPFYRVAKKKRVKVLNTLTWLKCSGGNSAELCINICLPTSLTKNNVVKTNLSGESHLDRQADRPGSVYALIFDLGNSAVLDEQFHWKASEHLHLRQLFG